MAQTESRPSFFPDNSSQKSSPCDRDCRVICKEWCNKLGESAFDRKTHSPVIQYARDKYNVESEVMLGDRTILLRREVDKTQQRGKDFAA